MEMIKKNWEIWILIFILGLLIFWAAASANAVQQVCFCHNVNHNPHTICTSNQGQINGHLSHVNNGEDNLGPCIPPSISPTPTKDLDENDPTPTLIPTIIEEEPVPTQSVTPTPTIQISSPVNEQLVFYDGTARDSAPSCDAEKPGDIAWATYIPTDEKGAQEIRWTLPTNADKVNIRYSEVDGDWRYGAIGLPNTGNYIVRGLKSGQSYYYQIAGLNGCRGGNWSQSFDPIVK